MADSGAIRKPSAGTLTRADLSDIVHREIGLSRAESAGIVERILWAWVLTLPICGLLGYGVERLCLHFGMK